MLASRMFGLGIAAVALATQAAWAHPGTFAFTIGNPRLGVACVMCALPLLIPIVVVLMHKMRKQEVQL